MAYTAAEGRLRLLEDLAGAVEQLSVAVASLGEAYELLDERLADTVEQTMFRPAQGAYGRATRTFNEFASRYQVQPPALSPGSSGPHATDPRVYIQRASDAAEQADLIIAELQDSMLPVEVGDRELRESLAGVRELIADLPSRAGDLLRTVGR
jgi:hypothetical protein